MIFTPVAGRTSKKDRSVRESRNESFIRGLPKKKTEPCVVSRLRAYQSLAKHIYRSMSTLEIIQTYQSH